MSASRRSTVGGARRVGRGDGGGAATLPIFFMGERKERRQMTNSVVRVQLCMVA